VIKAERATRATRTQTAIASEKKEGGPCHGFALGIHFNILVRGEDSTELGFAHLPPLSPEKLDTPNESTM
jgi:hypothetical protein